MKKKILQSIEEGITAIEQLKKPKSLFFIEQTVEALVRCFRSGNKVLIAGNGGSLCDAAHFAEEFTGFFRRKRGALPAIALSEPGFLSCVGNDLGFEYIFSRGVEALGKEGDLFVGLTTSGNSPNIVHGFRQAKERGLTSIAFLGRGGGKLKGVAELELIIEGFETSDRIQEAHMTAIHIILEMVEELLFPIHSEQESIEEEALVGGALLS